MKFDVSVIVPIYNTAVYLKQCIESILKQTIKSFELILIDDGSSDNSLEICKSYQGDTRVKVLQKPRGGVSSARNLGLDHANGKYIVFVDSDDYIGENYLFDLIKNGEEKRGDTLVCSAYQSFTTEKINDRVTPTDFSVDVVSGMTKEQFRYFVFEYAIFGVYCKLYRNDIIKNNHIRFNERLQTAEDFEFNMQYQKHIEQICHIQSVQYYYRLGHKVLKNSFITQSSIESVHVMTHEIICFAKKYKIYPEVAKEIDTWIAKKHYLSRIPQIFADDEFVKNNTRKKYYRELISDKAYREAYRRGRKNADLPKSIAFAAELDCFGGWYLLFEMNRRRNRTDNNNNS